MIQLNMKMLQVGDYFGNKLRVSIYRDDETAKKPYNQLVPCDPSYCIHAFTTFLKAIM